MSPGVIVQRNAEVEESVIFDDVVIGSGARVKRAIIDKLAIIQPGASLGYNLKADVKKGCTLTEGGVVAVPKEAVIEAD